MNEDIYSFGEGWLPDNPFHLQMTGISYCDGTYRIERRNSQIYVFEYVIKGKGYLNINSIEYYPEAGDIYIVPAGSDHFYRSSKETPWTKIWFNVYGSVVGNLLNAYKISHIHHVKNLDLEDIFRDGFETAKQKPTEIHQITALKIHQIIIAIAGKVGSEHFKSSSPEATKLKAYLDNNILRSISIEEMSRLISKSPSQTIRLFKKQWGVTPHQYHLNKKVETAKLILANTMKSVKEIAYELNFADEYYFSNIFKQKVGISPARFKIQRFIKNKTSH